MDEVRETGTLVHFSTCLCPMVFNSFPCRQSYLNSSPKLGEVPPNLGGELRLLSSTGFSRRNYYFRKLSYIYTDNKVKLSVYPFKKY